ncbi:hypothetical protein F4808DRAFT_451864 [Astrocystis sublimbata]|nr:hypothetical protein F4808DRAFT_451864 [Astrocystis sublimbata]
MSSPLDFLYLLPPEEQDAIIDGPALPPPRADIIPNFDAPSNMNTLAQVVTTIALIIVTVVVILRAYVRIHIIKKLQLQDYLAFAAYAAYIGYSYSLFRFVKGAGYFVHQWDLRVYDVVDILYTLQIAVNFYAITLIFIKTCILLDWLHIFVPRGSRGTFFWMCHGLIWFNILFYSSAEVAGNLSCRPFNRIWDKRIPGNCFNRKPLDLTTSSVNLLCDVFILLAPQKVIWKLRLATGKKIGVSIVFAIGLLAVASAAARLVATVGYSTSPDFSYEISKVGLWSLAELTLGFLVFCIPTVPRLYQESKFMRRFGKSILSYTVKSKRSEASDQQYTPNDSGEYHRMQNSQITLSNLPNDESNQPCHTAKNVNMTSEAHQNMPLANQKLGITHTTQFTVHEERRAQPDAASSYNGWNASAWHE